MDEYAASRSHLEKLVAAAQSIKESLICRICLEYFKEPVTIKCGHKFCHNCIVKVANSEHATCPFCNLKIQKRSIPKNGNKLLQACVDQFDALVKAINSDSGIDVLETRKNIKHQKESVLCDKPSTSKVEESSNASKGSSSTTNRKSLKSKANLRRDSKLSLQKTRVSNELKSSSDKKNTLDKYLSNTRECTDNQVPSSEKVKIWLENHTPSGSIIRDSDNEDSSPIVKKLYKDNTTQKLPITQSEPNIDSLTNACSSKDKLIDSKVSIGEFENDRNNDSPYKEVQLRVQEVEMIAKKKKASFSIPDRTVLRTPSSVPAASHSDAYDWRRIKKVGKEMQIKTFKSLNVSVERSSSSIALDDTVICNSTNNDKNTSRESDTNNHSCINTSSEIIQKKLFRDSRSTRQKENLENVQDCNNKQHLINSSDSHQAGNVSLSCVDPKQVNEIIDIVSETDVNTPEKTRNALNVSNQEYLSKLNRLSPLNVNLDNNQQNSSSDDKSLKLDSKSSTNNIPNSPLPKNKLSLKMKLTPSTTKPVRSQPSTPDKTHHISNQSPKDTSPERPRSRLSLRLQNTKASECSSTKSKSPTKISRSPMKSNTYKKKSLNSSNRPVIVFKKLGKICKKRKNVPFLHLGNLKTEGKKIFYYSNKQTSSVIIKSNIPVNVDYKPIVAKTNSKPNSINLKNVNAEVKLLSPDKDSQLKFLAIESPHPKQYTNVEVNSSQHINATNYESVSMEVDEIPMNGILDHHIDCQQEKIKNVRNSDTEIEVRSPQSKISENILEKNTKKKVILDEDENFSKTSPSMIRMSDVLYMNQPGTSSNILNQEIDDELAKSKNEEKTCSILKEDKTINKEDDVISISSNGSTTPSPSSHKTVYSENVHSKQKNMNKKCIVESSADSECSSTCKSEDTQHSEKKSTCTKASSSNSSVMASTLKKKRTFSESSNDDDDDVSSIIGKWVGTVEEPIIKKPKITFSAKKNSSPNQNRSKSKRIEDSCVNDDDDNDNDNTLVDVDCKQPEKISKPESLSIDNIISKVKHYRDNITDSNKLTGVPSSLSADMFESNEQPKQSNAKILSKQSSEVPSDNSSVCTSSPIKKTDKENVNTSQDLSELTMLDFNQFDKKKSNISENAEGSDKENNGCNQTNANTVLTKISNNTANCKNEIDGSEVEKNRNKVEAMQNQSCSSQINPYHDLDSLMNITQEQLAFKNIEKALGVDMSSIQHDKNEETFQPNKFETPKKVKSSEKNNIDDFDSDNIDATPVVKRRHTYINSRKSKVAQKNEEEQYLQDRVSPSKNFDLIPAITPVKNTKSYPIGHSTPMVFTTNVMNESATQTEIVLVCSSLDPEKMKTVHNFVNKFGAKFENNFSKRVTHVIVSSDPNTKVCNKTFKYIQGIAYNKYVISFQWIVDCLKENRLLNEDDAKYEVLDPDVLEPGSTKSRTMSRKLFEGFAMYCLGPFTSFSLKEFKDLLLYNGAVVVNSPQALSLQKDKFRMVIFDSENEEEAKNQLHTLKKSRGALICFDWVVDSISQYQISSLFTYLFETTVEEALALGFPPEYLVEETTIDEEEESES